MNLLENLKMVNVKREFINLRMGLNIMGIFRKIKWRDLVFLLIRMGIFIKEIFRRIKNKGMVLSISRILINGGKGFGRIIHF